MEPRDEISSWSSAGIRVGRLHGLGASRAGGAVCPTRTARGEGPGGPMGPAGSTTPLEQDRSREGCGPDQCKDRGTRLGLQRRRQWAATWAGPRPQKLEPGGLPPGDREAGLRSRTPSDIPAGIVGTSQTGLAGAARNPVGGATTRTDGVCHPAGRGPERASEPAGSGWSGTDHSGPGRRHGGPERCALGARRPRDGGVSGAARDTRSWEHGAAGHVRPDLQQAPTGPGAGRCPAGGSHVLKTG